MEINEHIASLGTGKGAILMPIGFPVEMYEDLLITVSNRKGQTAEFEVENVNFQGYGVPGTQNSVDMVYYLKAKVPYLIEGKKK